MIRNRNLDKNKNDGNYAGLDGTIVKNAVSGDVDGTPTFELVYRVTFADSVTESKTIVLPSSAGKCRVVDVLVIKTGGAGGVSDTIQVLAGATAVSDAISINIAQKAIARAATLDSTVYDFADGATITVTKTKASAANVACEVYLKVVRTA